ncbi:DNA polymerase III subunit gamma/tau [Candidatus Palauibacter sp.]|uniref:DNA polymerase III subunit gamma/tau n=1 Tax=Candidatus Palauibacter sp. TaxID=3101350 RepID=UPI003B5AA44C
MYRTALARTYRPRSFSELIGQDHVGPTLRAAIESGRVGHAYLFCGPRGVGKTTTARVLAMALNCPEQAAGEPCGVCQSCERIWSGGASLDVVEIDAASHRGVEDARDLRRRAGYAPTSEERYKVYILDEAHMLTRDAWNALLKILEEPPPRVIFAFATTEPQKIERGAAPVMSRCQRFDFRRVSVGDITSRLETVLEREDIPAEPGALRAIARRAEGGVRDALSSLDQVLSFRGDTVELADVRLMLGLVDEDRYLEFFEIAAGRDRARVFAFVQTLLDDGYDPAEFLRGLGEALRTLLVLRLDPEADSVELLPESRERFLQAGEAMVPADLLRMLAAVGEFEASGTLHRSSQPRIQLEVLLLRLVRMESTVALEELLAALGGESVDTPPARTKAPRQPRGTGDSAPAAPSPAPGRPSPPPVTDDPPRRPEPAAEETPSTGADASARVRDAWAAAVAETRGLGGVAVVALRGAEVQGLVEDRLTLRVSAGLRPDLEKLLKDRPRSDPLRANLASRLGRERLDVEIVDNQGGRMTAGEAARTRVERLMDGNPQLREAVDELGLILKE